MFTPNINAQQGNQQAQSAGAKQTNNGNRIEVPQAKDALNNMKHEIAGELGINLKQGYNGDLTSRQGRLHRRLHGQAAHRAAGKGHGRPAVTAPEEPEKAAYAGKGIVSAKRQSLFFAAAASRFSLFSLRFLIGYRIMATDSFSWMSI